MAMSQSGQPVEVREGADASSDDSSSPVDADRLTGALEAVLLTTDRPAQPGKLAEALGLAADRAGRDRLAEAVDRLNEQYEQTGRSFRIERVAGGYRVMTLPQHADAVAAYRSAGGSSRLSRSALETLAIIAYRQPITRAQIEAIRGVGSGEVVRTLLERRLIDIAGRAEEVGRPILYGTSKRFLEVFGLSSLKELPSVEDLAPPESPMAEQ